MSLNSELVARLESSFSGEAVEQALGTRLELAIQRVLDEKWEARAAHEALARSKWERYAKAWEEFFKRSEERDKQWEERLKHVQERHEKETQARYGKEQS